MHADVIASRQINQTLNKIIMIFINNYLNPPCKSSLATSCTKSEWLVLRVEWPFFSLRLCQVQRTELANDETASTVSLAPNLCVVRGVSAAVEEGEECVGEFVSPVTGEESAAPHLEGEADDNDSFFDIMSGITAVGIAESEGWNFADALARENLSVETLAEGVVVDTSRWPTRESSFSVPH